MKSWILPTFVVFVLWGLWAFIPKITIRYIGPKSAIVYEVLGGIIVAIVVLIFLNFKLEFHLKGAMLAGLNGMLGFAGALFFLYAVSRGPISLIAVLTALYPIIAVFLAIFFLGESLTLKQGIGIVLGIGAIGLLVT